MEIRRLRSDDDRSAFRSGDPHLDGYLLKFAGQNQFRHHIGTTYVAIAADRIAAYATVVAGHIEIDRLPVKERGKIPRYPLPVLRLARLAVDESVRDRGLGGLLLRHVLGLALHMASEYGCVGVVVDAKANAVEYYARFGFEALEALAGHSGMRPAPVEMFLSLRMIENACLSKTAHPSAPSRK